MNGNVRRVALVVPCYNEEKRLPVEAFCAYRPPDAFDVEFVFVDDGSIDATRAVLGGLRERLPRAAVIAYPRNQGKAEAVRRGVLDALSRRPDAVGFWDADLATPLGELDHFVDRLEQSATVQAVLGSRVKLMGRSIERHVWRHYMGRVFATAASVALELPVYDTQCGAKLFRATPAVEQAFSKPFLARWIFDVEILARLVALDARGRSAAASSIYELPVRSWSDVHGSKLKPRDFARAVIDLLTIRRVYGPAVHGRPPAP